MTDIREAKKQNRLQKERDRLAGNRSWNVEDASRETRQQVRAEGRHLEGKLARRAVEAKRKLRAANRPRRGESAEKALMAAKLSRGWFKRHENLVANARKAAKAAA